MSESLGVWAAARRPASWRGIPFVVRESELKRGRRTSVHSYVMRDDVWVEDLGRSTRITAFRGFLIGDDVDSQLQAMTDAIETAGDGMLVHPALGSITASNIEFVAREGAERGRVWELEFVFVSGSVRAFPSAVTDTQSDVGSAATDAASAQGGSFGSFVSGVKANLVSASDTLHGIAGTVAYYGAQARSVVGDVTALGNAATGLTGNFGRFSLGARLARVPGVASVGEAVAVSNAAVASVGRLSTAASSLARFL